MSDPIKATLAVMIQGLVQLSKQQDAELAALKSMAQRIENAKVRSRLMGNINPQAIIPPERFLEGFVHANLERRAMLSAITSLCEIVGSIVVQIEPMPFISPSFEEHPIDSADCSAVLKKRDGQTVMKPESAKLSLVKSGADKEPNADDIESEGTKPITSIKNAKLSLLAGERVIKRKDLPIVSPAMVEAFEKSDPDKEA